MTNVIKMDVSTKSGETLNWVHLPNDTDAAKVEAIKASMIENGWTGRKCILVDAGDHHIALTASHRLTAAAETEVDVDALILEDLSEEFFSDLEHAHDDHDLLQLFEQYDLDDAAAIIRQEIEAHDRNAGV